MGSNVRPLDARQLKLLVWTAIPTHHQADFFAAIKDAGVDLRVHYYRRISWDRQSLGWRVPDELPRGEKYVKASVTSLWRCGDWRERIHVLPGCGIPFLLGLAICLSMLGIPWLHWSEASNPNHSFGSLKDVVRRFYGWLNQRHGLGALAISDAAREDFVRWGIHASRIRYLPYSIKPLQASTSWSQSESARVRFLYLGALYQGKGIDILLKSFAVLLKTHRNAELRIVGRDDSKGEYAAFAEALAIQSSVSFSPSVSAKNVADIIASCDVLILPSRFDGWGMVLSEAASLGRALIATKACGGARHLIRDGVSGFQIETEDIESLAERMSRYCTTPELAVEHGKAAAAAFVDLIPEKNVQRLRHAIDELRKLADQK